MKKILSSWSIENININQITDTAWDISDKYVLKVYNDINSLIRNIKLLKELKRNNIPVAVVIPTKSGADYVEDNNKYYLLTEKLQGKNAVSICEWDGIARQMGIIIGKLHTAFANIAIDENVWKNSLLDEMQGWIYDNFEKEEWRTLNKTAYESTLSKLKLHYNNLPTQLIHRDVHFGNFLFSDGKFSGYIDFDLSQINIRIFDVCYFLLSLLVEEENKMSEAKWLSVVQETIEGYNSIIPLTQEEYCSIPYVMESIEILFISYFIGINDTECAISSKELYQMIVKQERNLLAMF